MNDQDLSTIDLLIFAVYQHDLEYKPDIFCLYVNDFSKLIIWPMYKLK